MAQQQEPQTNQAQPTSPQVNTPKGAKPISSEKPAGTPARQAYRSDTGADTSESEANAEGMAGESDVDDVEENEKSY